MCVISELESVYENVQGISILVLVKFIGNLSSRFNWFVVYSLLLFKIHEYSISVSRFGNISEPVFSKSSLSGKTPANNLRLSVPALTSISSGSFLSPKYKTGLVFLETNNPFSIPGCINLKSKLLS